MSRLLQPSWRQRITAKTQRRLSNDFTKTSQRLRYKLNSANLPHTTFHTADLPNSEENSDPHTTFATATVSLSTSVEDVAPEPCSASPRECGVRISRPIRYPTKQTSSPSVSI